MGKRKYQRKYDVTVEQAAANYTTLYLLAGAPDGNNWYELAHEQTKILADFYGIDHKVVIGIVAATSPMVKWQWSTQYGEQFPNLDGASALISGFMKGHDQSAVFSRVIGFNRNKSKAWKMLQKMCVFPFLRGGKVVSFYDNILNPFTSKNITIDIWMIRSGLWDFSLSKNAQSSYANDTYRPIFQAALATVAQFFGLAPLELQAIIWEHAKIYTENSA